MSKRKKKSTKRETTKTATKYNFSTLKTTDLNGKPLVEIQFHKVLANLIYTNTGVLDMVELAREMNSGVKMDLRQQEVNEIKRLLESPDCNLVAFVRKVLLDYIKEVERKKEDDKKKE